MSEERKIEQYRGFVLQRFPQETGIWYLVKENIIINRSQYINDLKELADVMLNSRRYELLFNGDEIRSGDEVFIFTNWCWEKMEEKYFGTYYNELLGPVRRVIEK